MVSRLLGNNRIKLAGAVSGLSLAFGAAVAAAKPAQAAGASGINAELGFGPAGAGPTVEETKQFMLARYEMEGVTDMFNRMTENCYQKCVVKHADADITVGEGTCLDRCVIKYIQAQTKVGEKLGKLNAEQTEAQAKQQQQQGQ